MTETSPGVTLLPPQHAGSHLESAGLAHFFAEYRIRDMIISGVENVYAAEVEPVILDTAGVTASGKVQKNVLRQRRQNQG